MSDNLRNKLEALSEKATPGEWSLDPTEECVSHGTGDSPPVYEIDYCAQIMTDDPSIRGYILSSHEEYEACVTVEDAALICALVNRFRSGDLVVRSERKKDKNDVEYIRADIHEAHIEELEAKLKKAVEALRWCAGSPDFSEGGSAYEGWNKICAPIAYPMDAPKGE